MKSLDKIFNWLLILPAIVPLVYFDGLLFPYMTPKTILFRGISLVLVAVFAYLVFVSKKHFYWNRLKHIATWIPAILVVIAYATSLINGGFFHGFWSSYGRGDGLFTLTAIVAFFYISLVSFDEKIFNRFIKTVSIVGPIVAIYACLQWIQVKTGMNIPLIEDMDGRIGGTLNNAAFLSSYLSITFFVTLFAIRDLKGKWFHLGWIMSAIQIIAIILSATRSSLLGLILALGIFVIYQSIKGMGKIKNVSRIAILALVILSILFFVFRSELKNSNIESVRRIASIGTGDSTVSNRLFVWKSLFPEAMKRPVVGYGSENIEDVFNSVYDPNGISEQWFDRSHNAFLDYFLQYGVFGLIAYVLMIVSLLYYSIKASRKGKKYGAYIFFAGILYAVNNFFVFDTVVTLWLFLMLLSFVLSQDRESVSLSGIKDFRFSKYIGYAVCIAMLVSIVPTVYSPLVANRLMAKGYKYQISDINVSSEYLKKGYDMGTYADIEFGHQVYLMYTEQQTKMLKGDDLVKAYETANYILSENFKKYPNDARTGIYLAHIMNLAPESILEKESNLLDLLEKVSKLSPKRSELWYIKANIDIRKGNTGSPQGKIEYYRKAILTLKDFIEKIGDDARTCFVIAGLHQSIGEPEQALIWAEKGKSVYKDRNTATAGHAVSFYISIGDWKNAVIFMEDIVRGNKKDLNSKYELAKLYYLTGNTEKSLEIYNQLLILNPDLVNSDPAFVKAIESIKGGNK